MSLLPVEVERRNIDTLGIFKAAMHFSTCGFPKKRAYWLHVGVQEPPIIQCNHGYHCVAFLCALSQASPQPIGWNLPGSLAVKQ